jgi:hypothetical protein
MFGVVFSCFGIVPFEVAILIIKLITSIFVKLSTVMQLRTTQGIPEKADATIVLSPTDPTVGIGS